MKRRYEEILLGVAYDLAVKEKDDQLIIASLERRLELNPADFDLRFSLAYKYSEMDSNDLSLLHYERIPSAERNGTTWNNLGVAFGLLGLPAKSVDAYREAENVGESLAMSNLANLQINAGFLIEAKAICENALKVSTPHRNVSASLNKLMGVPGDEHDKKSLILEKANGVSKFYKEVGQAMILPINDFPLEWKSPDAKLKFELDGSKFQAVGVYKRPDDSFSRLLLGSISSKNTNTEKTYEVTYVGKIIGHAFIGTVDRVEIGVEAKRKTILGSFATPLPKIIMWVNSTFDEIKVLEKDSGGEFKPYSMVRPS